MIDLAQTIGFLRINTATGIQQHVHCLTEYAINNTMSASRQHYNVHSILDLLFQTNEVSV